MKRVRISPGQFVVVSTSLADKAARVFASGAISREQIRELAAAEPKCTRGVLLGRSTDNRAWNKALPVKSGGRVERERATGRIVSTGGSADRTAPKRKLPR